MNDHVFDIKINKVGVQRKRFTPL